MSCAESQLQHLYDLLDKQGGQYNRQMIEKAFYACIEAHKGQRRASGELFYTHPYSVACILTQLGMDSESIVAALLHDVVEDTEVTLEEICKDFGSNIVMLVDGLTKLAKVSLVSREQQQAENIRKMMIAMGEDIRVIIIKLADRLHNMRTISSLPEQKQRDKALETLEIFAPIAHRLGIRSVKEELEDLAITTLDPIAYKEIEDQLNSKKQFRESFLKQIQERIAERVQSYVPNVYLEGRVKSIHGIYRKMYMQGKAFDEIYDIYAVRVIADTVNDCYNILGVIHDMFRPLPNRFKDYISTPKPNMYQSLHTTVIGREAIPFEVQIRTWDMHHTAEYGIAAHWKYKEGIQKRDDKMEDRLAWIRQIIESQKDADEPDDIVQTIKTDLAQEDVFAVTPKGDVISLPVGSTIVDFAFAVHTAVGTKMVGAKVDGRIVQLSHEIKTGQIIEILTTGQAGHGPSRDWLKLAKTSQARSKIRSWFKKERRPENIETGRDELEKEFSRNNIRLPDEQMEAFLEDIARRQHCNSVEDFYAAIGYGGILLSRIIPRIKDDYNKLVKTQKPVEIKDYIRPPVSYKSSEGVVIEGIDNCLVKLSKCCTPLPGDDIIGFITRGHGVSIHKRDCNNVPKDISAAPEPERWVSAYWSDNRRDNFISSLQIMGVDREGFVVDVTTVILNLRVPLHAINARQIKNGNCVVNITVSAESVEHLKNITSRLEKIHGGFSVERTNQ